MYRLLTIGLSHRTAPVEVRETLAVPPAEVSAWLGQVKVLTAAAECALLSTCNRVEVYLVNPARPLVLEAYWRQRAGVDLDSHLYRRRDREAAEHLFRVAAGLDAMVIGEKQVLGQVRQALEHARGAGTAGKVISVLFESAVRAARRVHAATGLNRHGASVSAAAVLLAERLLHGLDGKSALLVGAGKMGRLALAHLRRRGIAEALVCVRRPETAKGEGYRVLPLEASTLKQVLGRADLVITCTGAPGVVLSRELVGEAMKVRGRPLFIFDIAVPRDVDPAVGEIEGVSLFDIDGLNGQQGQVLGAEVARAEEIAQEEARVFAAWLREQRAVPLIQKVCDRAQDIKAEELERALKNLPHLGGEERRVLELMAHRLVNRVLHGSLVGLRRLAREPGGERALAVLVRAWEGRKRNDKHQQAPV